MASTKRRKLLDYAGRVCFSKAGWQLCGYEAEEVGGLLIFLVDFMTEENQYPNDAEKEAEYVRKILSKKKRVFATELVGETSNQRLFRHFRLYEILKKLEKNGEILMTTWQNPNSTDDDVSIIIGKIDIKAH